MADEDLGQIHTEVDGNIFKITADREKKRNSYTPEMMNALGAALTRLDEEDELWVGVLCAKGDHTTAGLDMPRFFGPGAQRQERTEAQVDPFGLGRKCRKPVIAAVQGITYTIGIEMMLAADIVVAAQTARFCQMEAKRGIAPFGGAHFRYVHRAGWGNAMYHLLLCDEFDAARAKEIGFVQEVVPAGQQIDRAMELAKTIAKNAPLGIQTTKQSALTYIEKGEAAAIAMIPEFRDRLLGSEDAKEGIQSFIERREANFKGR